MPPSYDDYPPDPDEIYVDEILGTVLDWNRDEDSRKSLAVVCVSQVPKSLSSGRPKAFKPQFVGLGLYHHSRSDLIMTREMKLLAAGRVIKYSYSKCLARTSLLSDILSDFYYEDVKSRNSDRNSILTADSFFLLALLHRGVASADDHYFFLTGKNRNGGIPLFNADGLELTMDSVLRDVFELENQVPAFVLRLVFAIICSEIQPAAGRDSDDDFVGSRMRDFCEAFCPLVHFEKNSVKPQHHRHLLDLMLHLIVPEPLEREPDFYPTIQEVLLCVEEGTSNSNIFERLWEEKLRQREAWLRDQQRSTDTDQQKEEQQQGNEENQDQVQDQENPRDERNCYSLFLSLLLLVGSFDLLILKPFLWALRCLFRSLLVVLQYLSIIIKNTLKVTHELLSKYQAQFPWLKPYTTWVEQLKQITEGFHQDQDNPTNLNLVSFPSATELHEAGILLKPAQHGGGISSIQFDEESSQFYLPQIKLDVYSEVIIRNLMAYELLTKSEGLIFTRFVQLMRGLVATPEDVNLLVREKIIHTELTGQVVNQLFQGMSEPLRTTKAPKLEEVIKKVNTKFERSQKLKRFMDKYVASGLIFKVLGVIVFLALTALQTYCSAYGCSRSRTSKFAKLHQYDGKNGGRNDLFISSM